MGRYGAAPEWAAYVTQDGRVPDSRCGEPGGKG